MDWKSSGSVPPMSVDTITRCRSSFAPQSGAAVVTTNRAISRVIRLALILDVPCVCLVDGNRCENNETFNHHLPER